MSLRGARRAERRERSERGRRRQLPEAGELLAVEAVDRSGLLVTSEGRLVRILAVTPPNPLIMSGADRAGVAAAYCHLVSRLRPSSRCSSTCRRARSTSTRSSPPAAER